MVINKELYIQCKCCHGYDNMLFKHKIMLEFKVSVQSIITLANIYCIRIIGVEIPENVLLISVIIACYDSFSCI